ncbi:MAG: hydrogenase maturation nickel metallochaperone HypA/HybF [Promethearchaeota archaeon]
MHEFSFATHIVDIILSNVKKNNVSRVRDVIVEVGDFTMIIPSYLEYCYNIIKENYESIKDSRIIIVKVPGKVRCKDCGAITTVHLSNDEDSNMTGSLIGSTALLFNCSKCKSSNTEIIGGKQALIKSMKVDE